SSPRMSSLVWSHASSQELAALTETPEGQLLPITEASESGQTTVIPVTPPVTIKTDQRDTAAVNHRSATARDVLSEVTVWLAQAINRAQNKAAEPGHL